MLDQRLITENDDAFRKAIAALARSADLGSEFRIKAVTGGGNNRVFCLDDGQRRVLLKSYFRHPDDNRDRLRTEFSFLKFAWNHGIRCIPEPLACDTDNDLGIYQFIDGQQLEPKHIGQQEIDQAAKLFSMLNRHRHAADAIELAPASEACFSLESHVDQVSRRVRRLQTETTSNNPQVMRFVQEDLPSQWNHVATTVRDQARSFRIDYDRQLDTSEQCLSPSDFGFHNALRMADGHLWFIDFEYAGWDDPAKMICDFFCQPAVPAPQTWHHHFADKVAVGFGCEKKLLQRVQLLLPLCRIKWCCIVLNGLLPEGQARRSFAQSTSQDPVDRGGEALERARQLLRNSDRMCT